MRSKGLCKFKRLGKCAKFFVRLSQLILRRAIYLLSVEICAWVQQALQTGSSVKPALTREAIIKVLLLIREGGFSNSVAQHKTLQWPSSKDETRPAQTCCEIWKFPMKAIRFLIVVAAFAAWGVGVVDRSVALGQELKSASQIAAKPELAILDTDIGDDYDDATATALALSSPELRLLGITTPYGDTELRARLLDRFLVAVGRKDIPVAAGISTPHNNVFTQAAYARQAPKRKHRDAAQFILDRIRAHPGQITLIAIGPLNNIQAAIERNPATFSKLKRVVMMGGSVYRGYGDAKSPPVPEWNILCDPTGAKELLASGVPVFMLPLDSTQIPLDTARREEIFSHGSPLTDQLTLLYHQWLAGTNGHPLAPILYDSVAVAYSVRPDLCPMMPMHLEVDDKGFTRPSDGAPNVQVCLRADEKEFLEFDVGRITK